MAHQTYSRICKLASCQKSFTTKRKSQEYHSANCRVKAFNEAKMKSEYERGWKDGVQKVADVISSLSGSIEVVNVLLALNSMKSSGPTSDIGHEKAVTA